MPQLDSSSSSYSHHLGSLPSWLLSALKAAKMKNKASGFLKQVISLLVSSVKAKSAAVKSKTSAVKTRLIIFSLLHNKKVLMSAISDKFHALMGQEKDGGVATAEDNALTIVQYNAAANEAPPACTEMVVSGGREVIEVEEENCHPDLRHSLYRDEDAELGDDGAGSVTDLVKNSRRQDQGEFVLEDEIDHVAELFIKRFHRQMRMQRLESFKRYQEMLERSA